MSTPHLALEALRAALSDERTAAAARGGLALEHAQMRGIAPTVIADMVELLDQGRELRGYADLYDLTRAGYSPSVAATLGPQAANQLAARRAEATEAETADA